MRRVVVTGLGWSRPWASGSSTCWKRLIAGQSGIGAIQSFDVSDLPAQIAGQVPRGETASGAFNADDWVPPKEQRKMDQFIVFALGRGRAGGRGRGLAAARTTRSRERTGVMIGSGIGGLAGIAEAAADAARKKGRAASRPSSFPSNLINLASGQVSIRYGFSGPNHAVVTACSTGAHAIGDAARLIHVGRRRRHGRAAAPRRRSAGSASPASPPRARCRPASTTSRERASRPWDKDRDGFVMGEGAGILVLEELEHAKARGAKIYAEVVGYGMSGDAYHITAPAEDGNGAFRAMQQRAEAQPASRRAASTTSTPTAPRRRSATRSN